jgi:DNA-binding transcriptional ArsR family regulator
MSTDDQCELLCLDLPHAERIRAAVPPVEGVETAAGHARALGDPTRLRITMALLVGDELCVCDMAWVVGASQALVSHHLRQLRTAGVVVSRKDGRMVMYRLTDRGRVLLQVLLDVEEYSAVEEADSV